MLPLQLSEIDPSELNILYCMLEDIDIPKKYACQNRRNFPLGHQAMTFGITRCRFKRLNNKLFDISNDTKKYPEIYNEILRIGNIYCPFKFNSIHLNRNVVCPPHKDAKNIGKSMLLSFGDYTGCNICIEDETEKTHVMSANCQPIIFNGSTSTHYNTDDLQGTKYSLVFFNTNTVLKSEK